MVKYQKYDFQFVCLQFAALEYVHSLDVVHNDVNPDNIGVDGEFFNQIVLFG